MINVKIFSYAITLSFYIVAIGFTADRFRPEIGLFPIGVEPDKFKSETRDRFHSDQFCSQKV